MEAGFCHADPIILVPGPHISARKGLHLPDNEEIIYSYQHQVSPAVSFWVDSTFPTYFPCAVILLRELFLIDNATVHTRVIYH